VRGRIFEAGKRRSDVPCGRSPLLSEFVEDPARLPDHIYLLRRVSRGGCGFDAALPGYFRCAFNARAFLIEPKALSCLNAAVSSVASSPNRTLRAESIRSTLFWKIAPPVVFNITLDSRARKWLEEILCVEMADEMWRVWIKGAAAPTIASFHARPAWGPYGWRRERAASMQALPPISARQRLR
jgi:hypothetical protein